MTNKSKSRARLYCDHVYLPDKRAVEIEFSKARYTENRDVEIQTQIRICAIDALRLNSHHRDA